MPLRSSTQPPQSLGELFERFREVLCQLDRKFYRNVPVGTAETPIAHGIGYVPHGYHVVPHSLTAWCETRAPDRRCIYLKASVPCCVDIEVCGYGTVFSRGPNGYYGEDPGSGEPVPPTSSDRLVAADPTALNAGTLSEVLTAANASLAFANLGSTSAMVRTARVVPSTATPLPNIPGGNPGTGLQPSAWDHQHPEQDAEVVSSRLYPTMTGEAGGTTVRSLYFSNVDSGDVEDCSTIATENPAMATVRSHTLLTNESAWIAHFASDAGVPNQATWPAGTLRVSFWAKMALPESGHTYTIGFYVTRTATGEATGTRWDPGVGSTPWQPSPQIRPLEDWQLYAVDIPVSELTGPASDRLHIGIRFDGGSASDPKDTAFYVLSGGEYQCPIATPWTETTPSTLDFPLLTQAELIAAGVAGSSTSVYIVDPDDDGRPHQMSIPTVMTAWESPPLQIAAITDGVATFGARVKAVDPVTSPASVNQVQWAVALYNSSRAYVATLTVGTSERFPGDDTYRNLEFSAPLTGHAVTPGDYLVAGMLFITTSDTCIRGECEFDRPERNTWLGFPVQFPGAVPGWSKPPWPTVPTVTGTLSVPTAAVGCYVTGAEDMTCIDTTGRVIGDTLDLTIASARKLLHGQTVAAPFAPLQMAKVDVDWQNLEFANGEGFVRFRYRPDLTSYGALGCWQLESMLQR